MKILIIEDDPLWQKIFRLYLEPLGEIRLAKTIPEFQFHLRDFIPDIVVADVQIEGNSMIDFLANSLDLQFPVLFTTGFISEEVMLQSVSMPYALFLSKPVERFTLEASVLHLVRYFKASLPRPVQPKIQIQGIRSKDKFNQPFLIPFNDVLFIRADGNYALVQTQRKVYSFKKSLTKMIENLPASFVRISKFVVINTTLTIDYQLVFNELRIGEFVFKVGRNYRKELLQQITIKNKKI